MIKKIIKKKATINKLNKMNIKTQRKIKKLIEQQKTIAEIKKKLKDQKLTTGNIYAVAKTFNLKITKSKMERIATNPNFQTLLIQKNAGLITTQEMADLLNLPFSTLYSFLKKLKKNEKVIQIEDKKVIHWNLEKGGYALGSLAVDPIKFLKKENNLFYFETKNNGVVFIDQKMLERIIERYEALKLDLSILLKAQKSFELRDLSAKPLFLNN